MKAIIIKHTYSQCWGDSEDVWADPKEVPPVEGAYVETYIKEETSHPTQVVQAQHEARIKEDGTPYIYSWVETFPQVSFEDWCQDGFDHHEIIESVETKGKLDPNKKWTFTRKRNKTRWVVDITTIEQLEKLLENAGELEYDPYYATDIKYILRIEQ